MLILDIRQKVKERFPANIGDKPNLSAVARAFKDETPALSRATISNRYHAPSDSATLQEVAAWARILGCKPRHIIKESKS